MRPLASLSLVLVACGCAPLADPGLPDFGAHYRIEKVPAPPVLNSDLLSVTLSYGGCRSNHEFEVRHRMRRVAAAELWLLKVSPDEPCDMLVTERRDFLVPEPVHGAAAVTLLGPDGAQFPLRP